MFLSFLTNIFIAVFEKTFNWGILVFVPLLFLFQVCCYIRKVNTVVRQDYEVHGKDISVETIVSNESIQSTLSTGAVNKLEYDKIRNVLQTKNLILLRSKANLTYIFRKDAFTKGNEEDFIEFLRGNGVKIK